MCNQAGNRVVQRLDPPVPGLVHIDVKGGLVELDDINSVGGEAKRLLVQQRGESEDELDPIAIKIIRDGVGDRHRARQCEFEATACMLARIAGLRGMSAPAQRQLGSDGRHHRLIAILADAHFARRVEIDAVHRLEKAVDEGCRYCSPSVSDVDAAILL